MSRYKHKTVKLRAYATKKGNEELDELLIKYCEFQNACLENRKTAYKYHGVKITKNDQYNELTLIRQDDEFWDGQDSRLARGCINRVDRAFNNFFKRQKLAKQGKKQGKKPGYPRFKSRIKFSTLEINDENHGRIKFNEKGDKLICKVKGLPRLEIPIKNHTLLPTNDLKDIKAIKIKKIQGKIYVCLTFRFVPEELPKTGKMVGVDIGKTKKVTTSEGRMVLGTETKKDPDEKAVKKAKRKVSRAKPGSKGRKRKVQTLGRRCSEQAEHKKQKNHELSTEFIRDYDVIILEKINLRNLTRSAKGTAENPGKNVKAKSGLNRELLAQNIGQWRDQLGYKAEWAGKLIIYVDPKYTSQTCSECGVRDKHSRKGETFDCLHCDLIMDADHNAAINILRKGIVKLRELWQGGKLRSGFLESLPEGSPVRTVLCSDNSLTECTLEYPLYA